jgi:hypothetical protein
VNFNTIPFKQNSKEQKSYNNFYLLITLQEK